MQVFLSVDERARDSKADVKKNWPCRLNGRTPHRRSYASICLTLRYSSCCSLSAWARAPAICSLSFAVLSNSSCGVEDNDSRQRIGSNQKECGSTGWANVPSVGQFSCQKASDTGKTSRQNCIKSSVRVTLASVTAAIRSGKIP